MAEKPPFNLGDALSGKGFNPDMELTPGQNVLDFNLRQFKLFKDKAQADARAGRLPLEDLANIPSDRIEEFNRSIGLDRPFEYRIEDIEYEPNVVDLFPHVDPIRRAQPPFFQPRPSLSGPAKIAVEALNPPLTVPTDRVPPRRIPSYRPFLRGGPLALGLAAGLYSGGLSEKQGGENLLLEYDKNPDSPTYWEKLEAKGEPWVRNKPGSQWRGEFSPLREQLPHTLFPPNYLNEMAGRSAVEGVAERTRQGLGLSPFTRSGVMTPEQLFKQRNDLEEIQLRDRPLQEVPEWDPRTSQAGGFFGDLLSKAMSTAQAQQLQTDLQNPDGTWNMDILSPPVIIDRGVDRAVDRTPDRSTGRAGRFMPLSTLPTGLQRAYPEVDQSGIYTNLPGMSDFQVVLPGEEIIPGPVEYAPPPASVTGAFEPSPSFKVPKKTTKYVPPPDVESAKDKAAREGREQRSAAKKQAQADTKKAVERAVKKSTATKSVKKVVTSKKNISDAVAAARGDVKSAVTIALTSGAAQRAAAKARGVDPSTVYGSTLRRTAGGRWAGGF